MYSVLVARNRSSPSCSRSIRVRASRESHDSCENCVVFCRTWRSNRELKIVLPPRRGTPAKPLPLVFFRLAVLRTCALVSRETMCCFGHTSKRHRFSSNKEYLRFPSIFGSLHTCEAKPKVRYIKQSNKNLRLGSTVVVSADCSLGVNTVHLNTSKLRRAYAACAMLRFAVWGISFYRITLTELCGHLGTIWVLGGIVEFARNFFKLFLLQDFLESGCATSIPA